MVLALIGLRGETNGRDTLRVSWQRQRWGNRPVVASERLYPIRRPVAAACAGAAVAILGGLIGLGGAEFRLPIFDRGLCAFSAPRDSHQFAYQLCYSGNVGGVAAELPTQHQPY